LHTLLFKNPTCDATQSDVIEQCDRLGAIFLLAAAKKTVEIIGSCARRLRRGTSR